VPSSLATELAGHARDIAGGVRVLLEVFERDEVDKDSLDARGSEIPPLFGPDHRGSLLRLAISSLALLETAGKRTQDEVFDLRELRGGGR